MQTNVAFADTRKMSRDEWLEKRRFGIGGSDAAAIMGVSPWSTQLTVYRDKIGEAPEKETTEAMRQGTDLEFYVADRFCEATGKKVRRCNRILQHPDYPWMLANIDRDVVGEDAGLECKTTSPFNKTDFENAELSPIYFAQCQHYMACTGASHWYVAVLVFGNGFHVFDVDRDEDYIALLIERERELWEEHVMKRIPPLPTGTDTDDEAIDAMFPVGDEEREAIDLTAMNGDFEALALYKAEKAAVERKINEIEESIKLKLGKAEKGFSGAYNVSWKTFTQNRIDSKRLKAEQPKLYAAYCKANPTRRFTVTEIKEA